MAKLQAKTEEQQEFVRSTLTDVASWVGIVNEDRVELDGWVDFDQMAEIVDYLRFPIWRNCEQEIAKYEEYYRLLQENRKLNDAYFKLKKEYDALKEKTKNLPRIATLNKRIHELKQENERLLREQNNKQRTDMEFKVCRTWEWDKPTKMEFNSLEELLEFTKQKQKEKESVAGLIISWDEDEKIWEAEIYDDYRE